jgi:Ran GTPase-activating protein (RanGAP) involved in mRNA processing and transport
MREGAQYILESARLSCLDTLVLQRIHFNDGPFASNPGWPRLRMLYLGSNRIGPEVLRALVSSNRLNGLEYLELNGNLIRSLGAKILATAHHWPKLQTLELRDNRIGPGGARMLKNISLPALKLFDIRDNWLGETGTALLRVSPLNQNKA